MTKSAKWFLAVLLVLAAVAAGITLLFIALVSGSSEQTEVVRSGSGDRVALVELQGVITESAEIVRQLKKHRENSSVRAIVLRIESPGGAVVPSQEIYEEVRKTRAAKPVVASMGSLAASGGYYVAAGCSVLMANPGTLTGSIGVISEFLQLQDALGKLGVGVKTVKSGKLKDAGSPARAMTAEDERYFQDLMDDVHEQFIAVVERERELPAEEVAALADGRVFTGRQALELGLVDTLGTYEEAIALAAAIGGIEGEPSVIRERKRRIWFDAVLESVTAGVARAAREVLDRPVLSYRFVGP